MKCPFCLPVPQQQDFLAAAISFFNRRMNFFAMPNSIIIEMFPETVSVADRNLKRTSKEQSLVF